MIERVHAVIGANYGDEGKGLWTNHLCFKSIYYGYKYNPPRLNIKPLVVLCNGGPQRGHTVVEDGVTHVFHHFGSGTLANVPTLLTKDFVLNPLIFRTEYEELEPILSKKLHQSSQNKETIKVFADKNCMVTTPYDMLLNQYQMENDCAHNSCGVGVWETINRYTSDESPKYSKYTLKDFNDLIKNKDFGRLSMVLDELRYSMEAEIKHRCLKISDSEKEFLYENSFYIKENFIGELMYMLERITIIEDYSDLDQYTDLIFEMGQGLALDKDIEDKNYSTPSNTGVVNLLRVLPNFNFKSPDSTGYIDCNVYYISRGYLTRHGEGKFKEFNRSSAFRQFVLDNEKTNTYNSCQGEFRVGPLDLNELNYRINKDFWENLNYGVEVTRDNLDLINDMRDCDREIKVGPNSEVKYPNYSLQDDKNSTKNTVVLKAKKYVVLTHMDELAGFENEFEDFYTEDLEDFADELVYGRERKDVF